MKGMKVDTRTYSIVKNGRAWSARKRRRVRSR